MKRKPIEHADLLNRIRYNKDTGIFHSKLTGMRIGSYDHVNDNRTLNIDGKKYQEKRVAVFYVTGQWPKGFVKNKSKCKNVTKFKDLIFKLPETGNVTDEPDEVGIFGTIWRWLNG